MEPRAGHAAWVYILRCRDDTLYTGWTYDVHRRLRQHEAGTGSKYVRTRLPFVLVYAESVLDKSSAMRRESYIKKLTRSQKEQLIQQGVSYGAGETKDKRRV